MKTEGEGGREGGREREEERGREREGGRDTVQVADVKMLSRYGEYYYSSTQSHSIKNK